MHWSKLAVFKGADKDWGLKIVVGSSDKVFEGGPMNRYLIGILALFLLTTSGFSIDLDRGHEDRPLERREQLFEQAQAAVEQSKQLREQIAQEGSPGNYREIASEDEHQWQREIDQILAE